MKIITFEDIYILGTVVLENDLYKHFHYPEMLSRYDSNFIEFKKMPSLTELKDSESYLRKYHLKKGQKHIKFSFPANKKLPDTLIEYLTAMRYEIGFIELYAILPNCFPTVKSQPDIDIQKVTEKMLIPLIDLKYQHDLKFGSEFAREKTELIKRQFKDPHIMQLMAYYQGFPAGYADVIISSETAEIDGLVVDEMFRNKGIGSRLQKFVMELFPEKTIILVADGEDSPREMYRKQNYQYCGFKYEVQKVYQD